MTTIDKNRPALVTGATGYLAGRIIERLLMDGITVHAAVRNPNDTEKLKYLNELASKHNGTIHYFKADLLSEGSYDEAMKGCSVVFHTASPFSLQVKDPMKDLVEPAKLGTRNVLESAKRTPEVARVVVTSSCAAIYGDSHDLLQLPNNTLTEEVWNTSSNLEHQPYSFSKTEAEKEAWKIANEQSNWSLVTINPSFIIGPGINPFATSETFNLFKQLGKGDYRMGAPEWNIGAVDVRDVAEAHFQAGYRAEASGRHIVSGTNTGFREIASIIKKNFPKYPVSGGKLPKWLIWLVAPTVGLSRKMVSLNVGYPWKADNSKSVKELGINYRPLSESVVELFGQLVDSGIIKKRQ